MTQLIALENQMKSLYKRAIEIQNMEEQQRNNVKRISDLGIQLANTKQGKEIKNLKTENKKLGQKIPRDKDELIVMNTKI